LLLLLKLVAELSLQVHVLKKTAAPGWNKGEVCPGEHSVDVNQQLRFTLERELVYR